MSTTESSFQSRRPQRLSVAAVLVALAIGAGFYGLRSRLALQSQNRLRLRTRRCR